MPTLADDPRFADNAARLAHRAELREILVAIFAAAPSASWLARLEAAEVPSGPINDLAAVFSDPQVLARRMVETVEHPTIGPVRVTGVPYKLAATPGIRAHSAAAARGAHRRGAGLARLDERALREAKIV